MKEKRKISSFYFPLAFLMGERKTWIFCLRPYGCGYSYGYGFQLATWCIKMLMLVYNVRVEFKGKTVVTTHYWLLTSLISVRVRIRIRIRVGVGVGFIYNSPFTIHCMNLKTLLNYGVRKHGARSFCVLFSFYFIFFLLILLFHAPGESRIKNQESECIDFSLVRWGV